MEQPVVSANIVLSQIKNLWVQNGESLSKKNVKKSHPEILRNALYYYPSWEHALTEAITEQ